MRNKTKNGVGVAGAATPDTKCMTPDCDRTRRCRGLCHSCYQTARNIAAAGLASWDDMIRSGKCLPGQERRSKVTAWFLSGIKH